MQIPDTYAKQIRAINVNKPVTLFSHNHWSNADHPMRQHIDCVYNILGDRFTRENIVSLYQLNNLRPETKFVAAMIWGHEAGEGGQRDGRGPWKVSQMFTNMRAAIETISATSVSSRADIADAYARFDGLGALPRCGQSFFTKHFYFLGKAQGGPQFPVILDDRVAAGIARLAGVDSAMFRMLSVTAARSSDGYLAYLDFVQTEASRLACAPDQIELFLFSAPRDA